MPEEEKKPADPTPENPTAPPSNPPPTDPAAPPAAAAVVNGKTPREIELEAKLKAAEMTAMEKEDEAKKLKDAQVAASHAAKKKKKPIRWTLLHPRDEED